MIQSKLSPGDIISIKLINGEEIMGRLVDDTPAKTIIKSVRALVISQEGAGFMPVMMTVEPDASLEVMKTGVMITFKHPDLNNAVVKEYIRATSGIEVVSSLII